MKTIKIDPFSPNYGIYYIGHKGDHNAYRILFDMPDGTYYLRLQFEDYKYQNIPITNKEWIITSTYTDKPYEYTAQLYLDEENTIRYGEIMRLYLRDTIGGIATEKEVVPPAFETAYSEIVKTTNEIKMDLSEGKFIGPPGPKGDDYILTPEDKNEIALLVDDLQSDEITNLEILEIANKILYGG